MTLYSSNTLKQVGVYEAFNPRHQKDWVGLAERTKIEESLQMIDGENRGWGQN